MFNADFEGYVGGDLQQWYREKCTRAHLANSEMNKPRAQVRARRGLDYGQPRYDADVWDYLEPTTDKAKEFMPRWEQLDQIMLENGVWYQDDYQKKCGNTAQRR